MFSPSALIILGTLFFLLVQIKHCLSVIGRALQGSCPQCRVILKISCVCMAPLQRSGAGIGQIRVINWNRPCQVHRDISVLSRLVSLLAGTQIEASKSREAITF